MRRARNRGAEFCALLGRAVPGGSSVRCRDQRAAALWAECGALRRSCRVPAEGQRRCFAPVFGVVLAEMEMHPPARLREILAAIAGCYVHECVSTVKTSIGRLRALLGAVLT